MVRFWLTVTALLVICASTALAQCPSGMNAAWSCLDRPGDGSNLEVEIFKPASVTLSGGTVILTEDNSPTVTASGTYLTADVPPLSCSGSGNPGTYACSGIYSSGRIMWTSFNQQYGDFQIRAKLGYGWPAIRMMGSNCQTTEISGPSNIAPCSWSNADSGELDIAEGSSSSAGTTSVLHDLWELGKTNPACTATGLTDITANYHVYEVIVPRIPPLHITGNIRRA